MTHRSLRHLAVAGILSALFAITLVGASSSPLRAQLSPPSIGGAGMGGSFSFSSWLCSKVECGGIFGMPSSPVPGGVMPTGTAPGMGIPGTAGFLPPAPGVEIPGNSGFLPAPGNFSPPMPGGGPGAGSTDLFHPSAFGPSAGDAGNDGSNDSFGGPNMGGGGGIGGDNGGWDGGMSDGDGGMGGGGGIGNGDGGMGDGGSGDQCDMSCPDTCDNYHTQKAESGKVYCPRCRTENNDDDRDGKTGDGNGQNQCYDIEEIPTSCSNPNPHCALGPCDWKGGTSDIDCATWASDGQHVQVIKCSEKECRFGPCSGVHVVSSNRSCYGSICTICKRYSDGTKECRQE